MLPLLLLISLGVLAGGAQSFSQSTQCGRRPFCEAYEDFCTGFAEDLVDGYGAEELPWLAKINVTEWNPRLNSSVECVAIVLSARDLIVSADCFRAGNNSSANDGAPSNYAPYRNADNPFGYSPYRDRPARRPDVDNRNRNCSCEIAQRNVSVSFVNVTVCECPTAHNTSAPGNTSGCVCRVKQWSTGDTAPPPLRAGRCDCRRLHFGDNSTRANFSVTDVGNGLALITLADRLGAFGDTLQPSCLRPSTYDDEAVEMRGVVCGFRRGERRGGRGRGGPRDQRRSSRGYEHYGEGRRSEYGRQLDDRRSGRGEYGGRLWQPGRHEEQERGGRRNEQSGGRSVIDARQLRGLTFSCRNISFSKAPTAGYNRSSLYFPRGGELLQEFVGGAALFQLIDSRMVMAGLLDEHSGAIVSPADCEMLSDATDGRVECAPPQRTSTVAPVDEGAGGSAVVPIVVLSLLAVLVLSLLAHCVYKARTRAPYTNIS